MEEFLDPNQEFGAFYNSFKVLLSYGRRAAEKISDHLGNLFQASQLIRTSHETGGLIHITGMGRSNKVGLIIGELLKDAGYNVSYLGKTLARSVRENDVVIAISGSGWTNTTLLYVDSCIRKKATIIAFTGDIDSKLGRLADIVLLIPRKMEEIHPFSDVALSGYIRRQVAGIGSPLTPMGTLFEITSFLVGSGLVATLRGEKSDSGSKLRKFQKTCREMLSAAEITLEKTISNSNHLRSLIKELSTTKNIFISGAGMSGIVASIASIRFQHLGIMTVRAPYDWRFRKKNDLLLIISGSGKTKALISAAEQAIESEMRLVSLTSFKESSITKMSNLSLWVNGRKSNVSEYEVPHKNQDLVNPAFEWSTAIFLDSIVAQLAYNLKITEDLMRQEHSNVE
ncbi:MAG: SIS domain-containing protein [Candidatus Hodarchaeota archaeon]